MDTFQLLKKLTENYALSGCEDNNYSVLAELL